MYELGWYAREHGVLTGGASCSARSRLDDFLAAGGSGMAAIVAGSSGLSMTGSMHMSGWYLERARVAAYDLAVQWASS